MSVGPEERVDVPEPAVFADADVFSHSESHRLHGFEADPIADVGDLCDSDCVDCD
jgi:hypothetical protein